LPGLLVALHYAVQMLRPRMGYGSDMGGARTPWIIGGMAVLAAGGTLAAVATAWMETSTTGGIALAVVAFLLVGLGVGAAGTSLLVLLASRTAPQRRPAAASLVWIMMIAGFVVTTAVAGRLLDPYSPGRLIGVCAAVSAAAFLLAVVAVWGVERGVAAQAAESRPPRVPFLEAIGEVWREPEARRFTVFVFVSMLAYSAQDLILEPFAGAVFGRSLGEGTRLASLQHGGVLAGMILVALAGSAFGGHRVAALKLFTIGGCLAAATAMGGLAVAGFRTEAWPLATSYFALGLANGVFAAGAIATMMQLVGRGRESREGLRMGLWGAAQAIAFGIGGLLGAAALDVARLATGSTVGGYAAVFLGDAALFVISAWLALGIGRERRASSSMTPINAAVPR
ncbi:MAG: BCD family MFS transporter, partial [Acetobacteraceae bacterium]